MRDRVFLLVSVVLNTVLAFVLVAHHLDSRPKVRRVTRTIRTPTTVTNLVRTNITLTQLNFDWAKVESDDFSVYVQNLRLIGCPEETIRDIIVADVEKLFAGRRARELPDEDIEWWRADPHASRNKAREERMAALDAERDELLTRLLGAGWAKAEPEVDADNSLLTGPVLGALPAETKKAIAEIDARGAKRIADLYAAAESAGREPDAGAEVRIRREMREEFARLLSPAQLEEYLVRNSANADRIRSELGFFEPTPDEFRSIFRASDPFDIKIQADYSGDDAISRQARAQLEQQRENALKQALGPQRYEDFKLNQDAGYRDVFGALQSAGAPAESARTVHQVNQATQQEIERIRAMQNLGEEQRRALVATAEAERDRTLKGFLGEETFGKFTEQRRVMTDTDFFTLNMPFDAKGQPLRAREWIIKSPADATVRRAHDATRLINVEVGQRVFTTEPGSQPEKKKSP
ncbi:MAG: hypothetical protein FJ386_05940 [Verrucomicrobia bacterium]|nr:hypothetical protein [Verrucomicrobiota bacterium]